MTEQSKAFPFRSLGEWATFLEERGQLRRNRMDMNLRRDFGLVSKTIAEQKKGIEPLYEFILEKYEVRSRR